MPAADDGYDDGRQIASFETLRSWHQVGPKLPVYDEILQHGTKHMFSMGDAGREMIERFLKDKCKLSKHCSILEIGVWLGLSMKKWVQTHRRLLAVGVDPFIAPKINHKYVENLVRQVPGADKLGTRGFNVGLAQYIINSIRAILIEGFAPKAFDDVFKSNFSVDMVYIDGGKNSNKKDTLNSCTP